MRNFYKKGLSTILFLCLVLSFASGLKAQVSGYTFSQLTTVYSPITGGVTLGTPTTDDTSFPNLPIGFTFVYNNVNYTQFSAQSNGFIALGTAIASSYTALSTGATNNVIAGLNGDLQGNTTTGNLRYQTIGTAPNRTLVVQWSNFRHFGAAGDNYNFQIRLNESSNVVEVVYGSFTQNATARTRQVGLRGALNSDFNNRTTAANWSATTAGALNTSNCSLTTAIVPPSGLEFAWGAELTPTPTQDVAIPTCATGTTLTLAGVPAVNTTWYWQTTANGTSTVANASTPWVVYTNGTYYARAYNSFYQTWSPVTSSVTVSNIPVAPTPPAAVAAVDPSCAPAGTTISVAAAPVGTVYYWQGTTSGGTSNLQDAATPYPVTATGTYYVSAYETASTCWSATIGTLVTVNTVIPGSPIVTQNNITACAGSASIPANASVPVEMSPATCNVVATPVSGTDNTNVTATVNNFSCATGTITGATLNASIGAQCTAWYYYSIIVNGVTVATTQCNQTGFNLTPYLPLTSVSVVSYDNPSDGIGDFVTMNLTVVLTYSVPSIPQPAYSLTWYDAASAGSTLGTGSPLETVGTSVMPVAVNGSYDFYVGTNLGGCSSLSRELVTVNVADVNASLVPVDATCNGGNNGSFTLGTIDCGTIPFLYSVDGGAFGPIPTNLTAGTYSVQIQDNGGLLSSPISVVVAEPGAPIALSVSNILYFTADVAWTAVGNETQWNVEYGPTGFTPGTGTVVVASATTISLSGLVEETTYDVYVSAICGTSSAASMISFTTNTGFSTFDNACGPGFTDISTSGAGLNLADDASTVITLATPVTFQGVTSSSITVSNNGWISFGGVTLNAWNNDWDSEEGNVFWEELTIGADNYFVVEWYQRPRFSGVIGQNVTFELLMNQTTGEVYYIYDDVVVGGTQASNDFGAQGLISANGPVTNITVSSNNATYLTNNSCVHFYNALCPNPINVVSTIFADEVILDWATGMYGETDWTVIYGPAGFDPLVSGTTITMTTSDADITGLTQLTNYDIYIYSECMLDNLTSTGLLVSIQTLPFCSNPSGIVTATAIDSLFTSWNWVESSPTYPSTSFNLQYGSFGFDLFTGTVVNADNNFSDTTFNASFLAGGVYQVYVQAVCATDTSNYIGPFNFVMPLTNDTVCGAEMINADGTIYTFNNAGATVEVNENTIAPPATGAQTTTGWINSTLNNTTWFTFVAPASGNVRVNNTAINYAGQSAVYESTGCSSFANFTLVAANDNAIGGTSVSPNYTICGLTPGNTYYLLNDGSTAAVGNYSISISPINLNAGSVSGLVNVCTGDTINLFTTITGNDANGVWTAILASANTQVTDSMFVSSGLAYQVFDFEYRMTDGCAYDTIISQVEIYNLSSAGLDGNITVCRNEPVDLLSGLSGNVDLGGTWYNPSNQAMPNSSITASNIPGMFNYDYITGNGVCPDDSSNVLVTVNGACDYLNVQEMYFGEMSMSPNPTNGLVYISNEGSTEVFNYEITDVDGRVIATKMAAINGTSTTEVNLKGKVTGMYMIRVYNDNAEKVFRVILQ